MERSEMKLTSSDKRFAILRPVISEPRLDRLFIAENVDDFLAYVNDIPASERSVAIDFETKGNVPAHPEFKAVGVGLACSIGSIYLDLSDMNTSGQYEVLKSVVRLPLIAHNLYFDASVFYKLGFNLDEINFHACTYVLYKQLANEGFLGQSWGLAAAQIDMLGWKNTNKDAVAEWLSVNGHTKKNVSSKIKAKLEAKEELSEDEYASLISCADKSQLFRAPVDVLGHYCCLDAESTWMLYDLVLSPALSRVPPQTWQMHQDGFIELIKILIENHFIGITVDLPRMQAYNEKLIVQIDEAKVKLRSFPGLCGFIQEKEEGWLKGITVPPQFKKDGKLSKNYENYLKKLEEIKLGTNEKLNKEYRFNMNGDELAEYVYSEYLTYDIIREAGPDARGRIKLTGGPVNVGAELDMTKSGALPMDKAAFPNFGELGTALLELSKLEKLQQYVSAGIAKALETGDGKAHPQYRVHGTLTSRLAGGGDSELKANYQQLPSDSEYLSCYICPPDTVMIQADVAALEPHCLAELSRSKKYLELYGPNAKSHDIYLFNGLNIKYFKKKVVDSGYNPDEPASIEAAKSALKKERNMLKVLTLSSSYGAGPGKIFATLKQQGVNISFEEVEQIHKDYWGPDLYGDVKEFEREIAREWKENGGWYLDGLGCVVCLDEKRKKDYLNACIQRTGHEILILFLTQFLKPRLREAGLWFSWYLPDMHDETIYLVKKEDAKRAMEIHQEAVSDLNKWLGGVTSLDMSPKLINNLAERKLDEKYITIEGVDDDS
jgi:hypothetical protein